MASNFWATGWHFYLIAGRFAAPFALWWFFRAREVEAEPATESRRPGRKKKRRT
jgi:hypothetical protein